jgi:16S rRNA (guanine1207-N2)-methyltransferase
MLSSQIHKRISFNFQGQKLIFDTSQELFSFAKVDEGTKELLNSLRKNSLINYKKILDFGCGYGAMGIFLKKIYLNSEVLCSDRDSLAIDFAEHNSRLNNVSIKTLASLDYGNIFDKFSLIVCNFPAKLEKKGLKYFLSEASQHLEKDGTLAIVVVKELKEELENILAEFNLEGEKIKINFKQKSADYFVCHLSFNQEIKKIDFSYLENELNFKLDRTVYSLRTTSALQEWDTPHFNTELIISLLKNLKYKSVAIINPGQGFIPLAAIHPRSLDKIFICSNDLLQLKMSSENLRLNAVNGAEIINQDFCREKADLLIWSIHDEDFKTIEEKFRFYKSHFIQIIFAGRINILNRLIKKEKIKVKNSIQKGKYLGILI